MSNEPDPDAYLHYTGESQLPDLIGWLVKYGQRLRQPKSRFFRLHDSTLSNHRNDRDAPTWSIALTNARIVTCIKRRRVLLYLPKRRLSLVARDAADFKQWVIRLVRAAAFNISLTTFYEVGRVIGDGVNGDVLHGRDRATGDAVAIKTLPYNGDMEQREDSVVEEEIRIAKPLDHPHLVRTIDIFRAPSEKIVHLVMEFVPGGELRERVDQPDGSLIKETDGVLVARNLLEAVLYLHQRGIVHRDIKLENVLCMDADLSQPVQVKLADFGSSATVTSRRKLLCSTVGTGYYLAPEILQEKEYDNAVDMWALGVLFYITLSGQLPFPGGDFKEYSHHVLQHPLEFPDTVWQGFSEDVKDFISRLMEKDASKRMSAKDALGHPWVSNDEARKAAVESDVSKPHDPADVEETKSRRRNLT